MKKFIVPLIMLGIMLLSIFRKYLDLDEISVIIAIAGLLYSAYVNNMAFKRDQIIRSKDSIVELTNSFFTDIKELVHQNKPEQEIEDFITDRISSIEIRVEHLKIMLPNDERFISTESLTNLRNKPQEFMENNNHTTLIRKLDALRNRTLNEIEENYKKWLKETYNSFI